MGDQNTIRNLSYIRSLSTKEMPGFGAKLYEALQDLITHHANLAQQVNGNSTGQPQPPPNIDSLHVTAKDGIFDVKINDNGQITRGTEYFLEHSTSPNFSAPTVVHVGTSRNWRGSLGNQKLYWRAYSGYSTSGSSAPVYFGSSVDPTLVTGGGSASGPPIQPSSGSGTSSNDGTQGGNGYGPIPFRSTTGEPPIR